MSEKKLKGEGDLLVFRMVRRQCEECGEIAFKKATFLFPMARTNPESAGYRKDDISWCSDAFTYYCLQCYNTLGCKGPTMEDYEWCSTFEASDQFAHMFLVKERIDDPALVDKLQSIIEEEAS